MSDHQDTGLLSFFLDEEETIAFWLDSRIDQPYAERLPISRDDIRSAVARLQELFSVDRINVRRPERTANLDWLRNLGTGLLRPFRERLRNCRRLVIAPHRELHALPLHMLDWDGGQPLGLTHSVTYSANLSAYARLLKRERRSEFPLLYASACFGTAAAEDAPPVHECFEEAPLKFAQLSGGAFWHGTDASVISFRGVAPGADVLYLSCHGFFDADEPLESALLLSDGASLPSRMASADYGHHLTARDIIQDRITSRVVILQACTSGRQQLDVADEPMGFPAVFLLAGASAVIASNWVVERNCGREFMNALAHRWCSKHCDLGDAVNYAWQETRKRYSHPFHWAVFSLYGNDRLRGSDLGTETKP